jgi:DNA-3-methyladenine glycosylase II
MQSLQARFGQIQLREKPAYEVLSRSIIAQQISTKAANTIRSRLHQKLGEDPSCIASASLATLRSLGLTESKAVCLRQVADLTVAGEFASLKMLEDTEVRDQLLRIRGVGPWTVDMFLIFGLARPNIWPLTDAGLRAAAKKLYGMVDRSSIHDLGDRFRPFRSIAAIYLWKSLDNSGDKSIA